MKHVPPNAGTPSVSNAPEKVVYDCNIHLQFLLNPHGPAGACVQAALQHRANLIISYYLLDELRQMPERATPRRLGLTADKMQDYIKDLVAACTLISHVPSIFVHPIDEYDSHYVNLAHATHAKLIVSRDRHLLGLMDPAKPWSAEFRTRFSDIHIMTAEQFLALLRQQD